MAIFIGERMANTILQSNISKKSVARKILKLNLMGVVNFVQQHDRISKPSYREPQTQDMV